MKKYFSFLTILLICNHSSAQTPFKLGAIEEVQSIILNEKRVLNVYMPDEYQDSTQKKYPVMYLLDGSANEDFVHTVGLVQFLTMIGAMEPTIVVGIANVDRKRDFTFPTTIEKDKKDFPTTGGSANFIAFIEKELQPFINNKYRTNTSKTIIGQSLGGLLATEILLTKTYLFTNYIIVSPSLWWDNESLLKKVSKKLPLANTNVFIAVGNEEQQMKDDAHLLFDELKTILADNYNIRYLYLVDEDHRTILHNALYKAFYPTSN